MATQPLKKFRAGSIACALWENEVRMNGGKTTQMLKASVERRYKDKDGAWKSSGSFSRNEIPLVIYCLEKAFGTMIEEQSAQNGNGVEVEEVR